MCEDRVEGDAVPVIESDRSKDGHRTCGGGTSALIFAANEYCEDPDPEERSRCYGLRTTTSPREIAWRRWKHQNRLRATSAAAIGAIGINISNEGRVRIWPGAILTPMPIGPRTRHQRMANPWTFLMTITR